MADLLTTRDAAEYLGLSASTLEAWRTCHPMRGPAIVKLGSQVRYRKVDLDAFIEQSVKQAG